MKRILVIRNGLEDQLVQGVKLILQKNSWKVLEYYIDDVFSSPEATQVDLIVCYSEIPSLSIYFEKLRANPETETIPIFLIADKLNQRMSQFGSYIENWVTLPFSENELVLRMMDTLSKSRN
jgi:DNA-binding response OmpR family regulator